MADAYRDPAAPLAGVTLWMLIAGTLGGCGGEDVAGERAPWLRPVAERMAAPFPRAIPASPAADGQPGGTGATTVSAPPRAVAAASVFAAEVLLAIAPERVCAVHQLAADPAYSMVSAAAAELPAFAGGDAEHILSFDTDLVITDPFTHAATQSQLEQFDVAVVRTKHTEGFDAIRSNLRMLGYAIGLDEAAEDLVRTMDATLANARRPDQPALRVLSLSTDLFTLGRGSLMDAVIRHVGCTNLAAVHGCGPYAQLNEEHLLDWGPDVLVLAAIDDDAAARERQRLRDHPTLGLLACVRRDRLVFLPGRLLGSTSHHLADAAARLAEALDPWR